MRCLVIDDEPLALDILCDYIKRMPELTLLDCITDPFKGLDMVQNGEVDLLFLDIQMPELSGIDFLKKMDRECDVILTTAYPEYALDGYDLNVVDYLLKPFAFERFKKAVEKAIDVQNILFVKVEHKMQKVDLEEVLYIEGLKDYISIYTGDERIITLQNLKKIDSMLPNKRFVRVHKSYIVAVDKINSIERGKISIGEKQIPIGDTYRDLFYKRIENRRS
ncbi:LytR/AlgR family response regulator transcription factor [Albibacterium profundi]|uniref:LytTR family DNA-binding domain-containing protein n=1 Tax=Albibacterium profundi TaxID=3134906 RepID=A0ABV5CGR7_9SPHI